MSGSILNLFIQMRLDINGLREVDGRYIFLSFSFLVFVLFSLQNNCVILQNNVLLTVGLNCTAFAELLEIPL
jgi:hypothetical protein